ncbi:MAG: hypothetical protein KJZ60_10110, partial [Ignavibacteriaceae bacterium]|nr:hypothetical protein [Ignavibacteriaceae bacterium]
AELVEAIESQIEIIWRQVERLPEHAPDHAIPGLFEISRMLNIVPPIPYAVAEEGLNIYTFSEIKKLFSAGESAAIDSSHPNLGEIERYQTLYKNLNHYCGGRPSNILAVCTLSPDLKGYTELFARNRPNTINDLANKLSEVIVDIQRFLPHLVPMNSIKHR